jgi:hypothetical protein
MSAEVSSSVHCAGSSTGQHHWLAITMQLGTIVGVDSTGAPVFIPDDTADAGLDSPCYGGHHYGCAHCDTTWHEGLTTT